MATAAKLSPFDAAIGKPPALAADATVADGLLFVLATASRNLRQAQRGDPSRPETVHRFRVGLRRLRSLLSVFQAVLPAEERHSLSRDLAAIARRAGRIREWDVLLSGTLAPLRAALPENGAAAEVVEVATEERRRILPEFELGAAVASIAKALEAAPFPSPGAEDLQRPLKDFATDMLGARHKRVRKQLKHIDLADQTAFHDVRIETKKLRYPAEIFLPLYKDEPETPYLPRLITVQSALGHLNDLQNAETLLATLPLSGRSRALVDGWIARDAVATREGFPAIARAFRRGEPFWR